MIVKLDEQMLTAIGFNTTSIAALRHMMRQIGIQEHGTTLPEVAGQTDALTPIVNGLVITIKATNIAVAELAVDAAEHLAPDSNVLHRLAELEAALEQSRLDCAGLRRAVEEAAINADTKDSQFASLRRAIEEAAINGEAMDAQLSRFARRISQLEDAQP